MECIESGCSATDSTARSTSGPLGPSVPPTLRSFLLSLGLCLILRHLIRRVMPCVRHAWLRCTFCTGQNKKHRWTGEEGYTNIMKCKVVQHETFADHRTAVHEAGVLGPGAAAVPAAEPPTAMYKYTGNTPAGQKAVRDSRLAYMEVAFNVCTGLTTQFSELSRQLAAVDRAAQRQYWAAAKKPTAERRSGQQFALACKEFSGLLKAEQVRRVRARPSVHARPRTRF